MTKYFIHFISIMTLGYFFIEVQALMFVVDIFTLRLDPETLSSYERFGYSSAGIGITLLIIKLILIKQHRDRFISIFAITLALSPVIYMASTWVVYEAVNRSPALIPKEQKVEALKVSVRMLSSPSLLSSFSFYTNTNDNDLTGNDIKQFIELYPHSDKLIRSAYIQGVRGVYLFSKYYAVQSRLVDKTLWEQMLLEARRKAYLDRDMPPELVGSLAHNEIIRAISSAANPFMLVDTYLTFAHSPLVNKFGLSLHTGTLEALKKEFTNTEWMSEKANRHITSLFSSEIYWDKYMDSLAWEIVQNKWDYLPNDYDRHLGLIESLRVEYSKEALEKYDIHGVLFPWTSKNSSPYTDLAYKASLRSIAPFFYDSSGTEITRVENFRDAKNRDVMVNGLLTGLNPNLRGFWEQYRMESISRLTKSAQAWDSTFEKDSNSNLVRVSTILPLMLLLSALLLVLNIISLAKISVWYSAAGLGLVALLSYTHGSWLTDFILNAVLHIAVKESQIFLY